MHHATLIVTKVLKGGLTEKKIPVVIHFGLFPIVGGDARPTGTTRNIHEHPEDYPKDNIEIGDMAIGSFVPLPVKDAREDNLWFLRRRSGLFGDKPGHGDYGIVDPADFQSIAFKEYFLAYLSDDPEAAVRRVMAKDPEVVERGWRFLDRQEVRRILKIDDPRTRADRLMPYFMQGLGMPTLRGPQRDRGLRPGRGSDPRPSVPRPDGAVPLLLEGGGHRHVGRDRIPGVRPGTDRPAGQARAVLGRGQSRAGLVERGRSRDLSPGRLRHRVRGEEYHACAPGQDRLPATRPPVETVRRRWAAVPGGARSRNR